MPQLAKKKSIKKETTQITFTEFDEKKYIITELRNIKLTIIGAAIGFVLSFCSFALTFLHPIAGAVVGGLGIALFKPMLSLAKVDTSKIEKKNYAGMFASYFFTWLAVWVILLNPPISDFAHPMMNDLTPQSQELSANYVDSSIYVKALILDNSGIKSVNIEVFDEKHPEGISVEQEKIKVAGSVYTANIFSTIDGLGIPEEVKNGNGTYKVSYRIIVQDTAGKNSEKVGEITVYPCKPPSIIAIQPPSGGIVRNDPIMFTVFENAGILKVYYTIDGEEMDGVKCNRERAPQYTCEISPKNWAKGQHNIVIIVIDMGGNECRSELLNYTRT